MTSILNVSVAGFAQRFVLVPKRNKLMHCGFFVRASVKEIKRENL